MMQEETAGTRLLIVDDDPLMRGMSATTLSHAGFAVVQAEGGLQALALFEQEAFDLVLLDVMMPDLDGYQVCARIRQSAHGARVPILMLTGLNDTGSIELAYQAGATDFIAKPINWTLLSHRVRYALRASFAVESAIRGSERLQRAQKIANMGSWGIAHEGRRFTGSPELARLLRAAPHTMGNATVDAFLERVCEEDRSTVLAARTAAEQHGRSYQLSFSILRFDGERRTVFEQAVAVSDRNGRQTGVEGITQDITDRVEAAERISRLAHYDLLTGLPNRLFFGELAVPALERSRRLGTRCALMHLDMDHFKNVNDALGHAQGDAVLVEISQRLQTAIRASDLGVASRLASESVVGRVGANAFTLLLVDLGQDRDAGMVAERLLQAVAQPIRAPGGELVLSASIGVALYPRDAGDVPGLARAAEQALYAAKAAGRSQYRFFDEAMNERASVRLAREGELRRAIAEGQLRLFYQPKVDASSGAIVGAEALVRWQHPQQGLVPPAQFVPLAEESGQILALTDWVLDTACADMRQRMDAGLPAVPVSVNLASPSFAHDALPGQLAALLARHRLDAAQLVLEVTETLLMADTDRVIMRLDALRARGFHISLDDLSTGYCSLSYLKRFPVDELKIDRAFVTDAWHGGRHGAIAASIIALGREFGLRVVAEGVETADQARFLLEHGCVFQQGYLYARPMAGPQFDALLRSGLAPAGGTPGRP